MNFMATPKTNSRSFSVKRTFSAAMLSSSRRVLMLLTGYADKESAIRAINEVGIWQYVEKPWDLGDLLVKMRQGLERRELVEELKRKNRTLEARLSELERAHDELVSSERLAAV